MTYSFNDFLGLLFVGWVITLFIHLLFSGLVAIFHKSFTNDDNIKINIEKKK
jgi:hypothetical protein